MISQEEEKMIEAVGWSITCHSPFEMEHTDGSEARGYAACEPIIKDAIEEYHEMKKEEAIEAEKAKKAAAVESLNLETINGTEIIEFLENARTNGEEEYELYDCSVSGFKYDSQEIKKGKYHLYFTGVFNNWGHDQDEPGQEIIISDKGVEVRVGEPFDSDGSDEMIEEVLTKWLKTHKFESEASIQKKFLKLHKKASEGLFYVKFDNKKLMRKTIEQLEEAYTLMK